jgi:phage shock protein A
MVDSIFVRVQRVVSSGIDSVVETAEQLSGTGLMRQSLREMDGAIARAKQEAQAARAKRLQTDHQLLAAAAQADTLKEQAGFAISRGREDLAQAAIARQIEVETLSARLEKARGEAVKEEANLDESLADLQRRKAQMERELAAFQAAQRAAASADPAGASRAARNAERAEEAFRRAMSAAGGIVSPSPSGDTDGVAEIEALQKEAEIAERLAALRGGSPAAPPRKAQAGGRRARA